MKVNYDRDVNILRVLFSDRPIAESDEVSPGLIVDYADDGSIVGVEVLNASAIADLSRFLVEHVPLAA
jgi:uncharacterized protein YuzE